MRVLVTTDGSKLAEKAIATTATWAREAGADVVLLEVRDPRRIHETVAESERRALDPGATRRVERGLPTEPPRAMAEDRGAALERARIEAEESLQDLAKRHLAGVPVEVTVAFESDVPEAIARIAAAKGATVIAMATRGRSGISQTLLGSVATEVVRRATVPVVLVGDRVPAPA